MQERRIPKIKFPKKSSLEQAHKNSNMQSYQKTKTQYRSYLSTLNCKIQNIYKIQLIRKSLFESKCQKQLKKIRQQQKSIQQKLMSAKNSLRKKQQKSTINQQLRILSQTLLKYQNISQQYDKDLQKQRNQLQLLRKQQKYYRQQLKKQLKNMLPLSSLQNQLMVCHTTIDSSISNKNRELFMTNQQHLSSSRHTDKSSVSYISELDKELKVKLKKKLRNKKHNITLSQIVTIIKDTQRLYQIEQNKIEYMRLFIGFLKNMEEPRLNQMLKIHKTSIMNNKQIPLKQFISNKMKLVNSINKMLDERTAKLSKIKNIMHQLKDQQSSKQNQLTLIG